MCEKINNGQNLGHEVSEKTKKIPLQIAAGRVVSILACLQCKYLRDTYYIYAYNIVVDVCGLDFHADSRRIYKAHTN